MAGCKSLEELAASFSYGQIGLKVSKDERPEGERVNLYSRAVKNIPVSSYPTWRCSFENRHPGWGKGVPAPLTTIL
ncbi:MAG: hypothetical protein JSW70_03170 [Syntrophobacterales bacterium]|nr:MAG: hypothetical protein JSW70_03170 [Syntrophobacterales bacterium]